MKVRIAYQVDIRDIPDTIADLIEKARKTLETNLPQLDAICAKLRKNENPNQLVEEISSFRESLASIDFRLEDCCFILAQTQKTESELFLANKELKEAATSVAEEVQQEIKEAQEIYDKAYGDSSKRGK